MDEVRFQVHKSVKFKYRVLLVVIHETSGDKHVPGWGVNTEEIGSNAYALQRVSQRALKTKQQKKFFEVIWNTTV